MKPTKPSLTIAEMRQELGDKLDQIEEWADVVDNPVLIHRTL